MALENKKTHNKEIRRPTLNKLVKGDTSLIRKLKREGRINDETINYLSTLTIEEIISLKLELIAKTLRGKLYAFPLWQSLPRVVNNAVLHFAITRSSSLREAALSIGLHKEDFNEHCRRYLLREEFEKDE